MADKKRGFLRALRDVSKTQQVMYYLLTCAAYLRTYDEIVRLDEEEYSQDQGTLTRILQILKGNTGVKKAILEGSRNEMRPYHFNDINGYPNTFAEGPGLVHSSRKSFRLKMNTAMTPCSNTWNRRTTANI